jgi:hypothetical protein
MIDPSAGMVCFPDVPSPLTKREVRIAGAFIWLGLPSIETVATAGIFAWEEDRDNDGDHTDEVMRITAQATRYSLSNARDRLM